jgi:Phosphotransferase enzyme family
MPRGVSEVLPDNLKDHPSVKAWRRMKPDGFEPQNIEVLKRMSRKSGVYRLTSGGSNGPAVIAKRCPAAIASLERVIYETLLQRMSLPALNFYGLVPEPGDEFCWLFLDNAGPHEYTWERGENRALAGDWLGRLQSIPGLGDLQALLPDRSPAHYFNLLRQARSTLLAHVGNPVLSAEESALLGTIAEACDLIESHWDEVDRFCEGVPRTLVHGDLVTKNLRIHLGTSGPALLVFDWEMAGWGVPATDLAQVDFCARPDLDAYRSALRQDLPQLDVRDIRRLTDYGGVLRMVNQIYWETIEMNGDTYRFLLGPLTRLKLYRPHLAAALRAVNWSTHD